MSDSNTSINVPRLGLTVTEVTLLEWLIDDGASVKEGDPVCMVESDKSSLEIEAPANGVLRQLAKVGDVIEVAGDVGLVETS